MRVEFKILLNIGLKFLDLEYHAFPRGKRRDELGRPRGEMRGEGSLNSFPTPFTQFLACKQALQGAPVGVGGGGCGRKETLQLRLWNLNICFEKVDATCWLAEMTLEMKSLPLARVFRCLFTFTLVSALRWLAEIWQLSRQGATGKLRWNSNSRDVVASSTSFPHQTPECPRDLTCRLLYSPRPPRRV